MDLSSYLNFGVQCNNPAQPLLCERFTDGLDRIFGENGLVDTKLSEQQANSILQVLKTNNIFHHHDDNDELSEKSNTTTTKLLLSKYYLNPSEEDENFLHLLRFEGSCRFAGTPGMDSISKQNYSSLDEYRASEIALSAYSLDYADMAVKNDSNQVDEKLVMKIIQKANESLQISSYCIEAYNILALYKAKTLEEALQYYREGKSKVIQYYSTKILAGMKSRDSWLIHDKRQYMRAIIGEANTLRKMGRYEEALKCYYEVRELDSTIHSNFANYINFQMFIPECLMKLQRWNEAYDFMKKNPDILQLASSKPLLWSMALCEFVVKNRDTNFCCTENLFNSGSVPSDDKMATNYPLYAAASSAPMVYEFLLGIRKLANVGISKTLNFTTKTPSVAVQAQYVKDNLELWLSVPGALEWAVKNCNTIFAFADLNSEPLVKIHYDKNDPLANFFKVYIKNLFPSARLHPILSVLHAAVRSRNYQAVKMLLDQGATIFTSEEPTPFHFACYYDYGRDLVKLFCEMSKDPLRKGSLRLSPLDMALNQANWKPLAEILSYLAKTKKLNQSILSKAAEDLLETSVYYCINGGEKCQRCIRDKTPHSKDVSFEKCIDLLILFGLDASKILQKVKKPVPLIKYMAVKASNLSPIDPKVYGITDTEVLSILGCNNKNNSTTQTAEELKDKGNEEFKKGNFNSAIELYTKAISQPKGGEIKHILYSNISSCYYQLKDFERAVAVAEKSIEIDNNYAKGYYRKAVALESLQKYNESLSTIIQGLSKEPNNSFLLELEKTVKPKAKQNSKLASSNVAQQKNICASCGLPDSIKLCGACKEVYYCSRECQAKDWPTHKKVCKK